VVQPYLNEVRATRGKRFITRPAQLGHRRRRGGDTQERVHQGT
jgi:hypothetical protein